MSLSGEISVLIYGASGHGKVVAGILQSCGVKVEGFVDDDPAKIDDLKILGDGNWLENEARRRPLAVALGIGDNFARHKAAERCANARVELLTTIHPTAAVMPSTTIARGVVVMPHAVINAEAVIGEGAIINSGAIVEHDCKVGAFAHLSPRAALGGNVEVGSFAWLGIGTSAIPGCRIGAGTIIGAGATVIHDVQDWVVAVGTPAREIKKLNPRF